MFAGQVMTVKGPVDPAVLGRTLMHEHVIYDISPFVPEPVDPVAKAYYHAPIELSRMADMRWYRAAALSKQNIDMSSVDEAIEELRLLNEAGGRTIVDQTPFGTRLDVRDLITISDAAGINIVTGCGYWLLFPDDFASRSTDAVAEEMIREFAEGIEDTGVRPGIIGEIGTSSPITADEEKSLRAAVRAQKATGMMVYVHLDPWAREGLRAIDIVEDEGADLSRVVIGHLNPTSRDREYNLKIAERGVCLSYDLFGYELCGTDGRQPPRDWDSVLMIAELVRNGFENQIVVRLREVRRPRLRPLPEACRSSAARRRREQRRGGQDPRRHSCSPAHDRIVSTTPKCSSATPAISSGEHRAERFSSLQEGAMSRKVRLAVFGPGSFLCTNHLPAIEGRDDVELVAAVGRSPERLRDVQERFGFPLVTDNVARALELHPDAVIVGATPDAHRALAGAALEAGAHVLCEKPFTTRAQDAWDLVELARRRGVHLLTAYGWNYTPMVRNAKALLDEHGVGTVEHMQIHMASTLRELFQGKIDEIFAETEGNPWARPPQFRSRLSTYTKLETGAGYNQGQISHALGVALWLAPLRGESVFAFMNSLGEEIDFHDAIALRFRGGACASISGACAPRAANNNKNQMEVRIFGSEGQLILDLDREFTWLYKDPDHDYRLPMEGMDGTYVCDGPANTLIDLALGRPVENCSPGELGAKSTEITEAAYLSWRTGRAEPVPVPR
jgi:predicted metal-dependent phosphotriesterase family hydrolase/predicted dehydrogenase